MNQGQILEERQVAHRLQGMYLILPHHKVS